MKALYDYTGMPVAADEVPDLSFNKDELMEVTKEYDLPLCSIVTYLARSSRPSY